jgi:phage terminase Nu1 subunit (DNA packaging protein)
MSRVETAELAAIFGVQRKTILIWLKEGMPVISRGVAGSRAHLFDTEETLRWKINREMIRVTGDGDHVDKDEAQRRKTLAEAQRQEILLAKERGEVVELAEMQKELTDQMIELRASMRRIPERCVLQLVGESDETAIKKVILTEVDEALVRSIGD